MYSSYASENITLVSQDSAIFTIVVSEEVRFVGKAKTQSVDEYPMIKAAKRAFTLAEQKLKKDNKKLAAVKKELESYVASTKDAIDESVKNKYEITNILRHEIVFSVSENGLKIIQDSFSDQASDRLEGTDIIYWDGGQFHRKEPDLKASPDYIINNTPVDALANDLFIDIERVTSGSDVSITAVSYNRTAAKNYANNWVRNTSYHCTPYDSDPYQDNDYYNYTQYVDFGCKDCTNYISQALFAGGISTSGNWFPYSYRWKNVDGLRLELLDRGLGSFVSASSSLIPGDLGMVYAWDANLQQYTWQHVVMVVGLNPLRYSGHTNDRRGVYWSSSLNKYFHMNN